MSDTHMHIWGPSDATAEHSAVSTHRGRIANQRRTKMASCTCGRNAPRPLKMTGSVLTTAVSRLGRPHEQEEVEQDELNRAL